MTTQCAWCGLVLTGEQQGEKAPLLPDASHGMCSVCELKMHAAYFALYARRMRNIEVVQPRLPLDKI